MTHVVPKVGHKRRVDVHVRSQWGGWSVGKGVCLGNWRRCVELRLGWGNNNRFFFIENRGPFWVSYDCGYQNQHSALPAFLVVIQDTYRRSLREQEFDFHVKTSLLRRQSRFPRSVRWD
jgi:hypothetical protein